MRSPAQLTGGSPCPRIRRPPATIRWGWAIRGWAIRGWAIRGWAIREWGIREWGIREWGIRGGVPGGDASLPAGVTVITSVYADGEPVGAAGGDGGA